MSLLSNPASSIVSGRKAVTTAGTEVALSTDKSRIVSVTIQAETDNTGRIVVGDSSIVATEGATAQGLVLTAGDSITLNISQLSGIYIDSTVNGDGVTFIALRA